jgi:NADH-quinone oxidoreductase subunit N
MTDYITVDTVRLLIPELILVLVAVWVYVGGAFSEGRGAWAWGALLGLGFVGYALYAQDAALGIFDPAAVASQSGPLLVDQFGHLMRWVILVVGALLVLLSTRAADEQLATDYLGSLLLILAGLMLVATAGELVLLFLGFELVSIPTYIVLFIGRRNRASSEATAKYFFLSILSAALLLYGFSFLYGVAGSTELVEIRARLAALAMVPGGLSLLVPLALVLMLAGLGFKMAAAPFHFYAPDVYQGTTAGNAGLLAVAPKIAGVIGLARLVAIALPDSTPYAWQVVMGLSIVTMTLGNVVALWQRNIRRLLAYSSIAHAGYLLIGLTVALAAPMKAGGGQRGDGLGAMLFYLIVYAVATTGAFAVLAYLGRRDADIEGVDELAGVGKTHPVVALTMAVFMFSLAGIPPLAGFWGKMTLFFSALDVDVAAAGAPGRMWFATLAVIGALNAAVAAAYYLRVIGVMYFRQPVNVLRAEGGSGPLLSAVCAALLVLAIGIAPSWLIDGARQASLSAHRGPEYAAAATVEPVQQASLAK